MRSLSVNTVSLLIWSLAVLFLSSCTPVVHDPSVRTSVFAESGRSMNLSEIRTLISSGHYAVAEKELVSAAKNNPDNPLYRKYLGMLYFKTANYQMAENFIRSAFALEPEMIGKGDKNEWFDAYYILTASMIRQNKLNSAASQMNYISDPSELDHEKRIMYELLWTEFDYRSKNFNYVETRAKNLLREETLENEQRLNLYYILAVSMIGMGRIDPALDAAIFLILNDTEYKYTRRTKRLLDGIVDNADEAVLEELRSKIADAYRELAVRSEDNVNLLERILVAINTLENSALSVEMRAPVQDRSYITKVKLFTDRDVTSVYLTSNDTIFYENPPMFDGRTLTLRIPDKKINSNYDFIKSLPGSGIDTVEWNSESDTLIFKVNLTSNLNITLERSSGEVFERYGDMEDRFSLKIDVYLPEQLTTSVVQLPDVLDDRYTIVLDPGHGGDDPGALSVLRKNDGSVYTEKEMNLLLCRLLKKFLEDNGYRVFLTRDGDYYPSLHERNRIAQNRNADMFLSVHLNSASPVNRRFWQTDRYYGAEMIVRESLGQMPEFINFQQSNLADWRRQREKALEDHKKLSAIMSRTIPDALHSPFNKRRNIVKRNLMIFSGMTIPHALIEAGFIINNNNLEYLLTERGQNALFRGILNGIEEFRKQGG